MWFGYHQAKVRLQGGVHQLRGQHQGWVHQMAQKQGQVGPLGSAATVPQA